jgi:uncharacterized phage-associated protein
MAPTSADRVAAWLINLSYEKKSPVSNLKLQKLLYYAQAWHLVFFEGPLFGEEIEAWVHGPVVPAVFRRYREHRWGSISKPENVPAPAPAASHLEEVWRVYGSLTAYDLERLTHSEKPWKNARIGLTPDASSNAVISKASIQEYYSALLHGKA